MARLRSLGQRLTYANVVATIALFIALGGTGYAVTTIGSKQIRNNSIRSVDVRDNKLTSRDIRRRSLSGTDFGANRIGGNAIKESTLGQVPSASRADSVGGFSGEDLKVKCPAFTTPVAGVCVEGVASEPATRGAAISECRNRDRLLPSHTVLISLFTGSTAELSDGGEWTSDVFESRAVAGQLDTVIITSGAGNATFGPASSPTTKGYRCMAPPTN